LKRLVGLIESEVWLGLPVDVKGNIYARKVELCTPCHVVGNILQEILSVETGEKLRITLPPNQYNDYDPAFSLDMRHLAFVRYTEGGAASDLYTLKLSADLQAQGSPERLTFYNRHVASPVWTSDGRSILFTRSEQAGNHSIWRINLSGSRKSEREIEADITRPGAQNLSGI